jgi:hypothetical protein
LVIGITPHRDVHAQLHALDKVKMALKKYWRIASAPALALRQC